MKTSHLDIEIRTRIDSFLGEITALVRQSALEAVQGVLGGGFVVAPARRAPGRPRKNTAAAAAPRAARSGKRSSEDVLAMADSLLAYVKKNEGQRLEQIAAGLATSTKELQLPVQKLFAAKSIKTKGAKRGTTYFAN
jgi:hypothetical protein